MRLKWSSAPLILNIVFIIASITSIGTYKSNGGDVDQRIVITVHHDLATVIGLNPSKIT